MHIKYSNTAAVYFTVDISLSIRSCYSNTWCTKLTAILVRLLSTVCVSICMQISCSNPLIASIFSTSKIRFMCWERTFYTYYFMRLENSKIVTVQVWHTPVTNRSTVLIIFGRRISLFDRFLRFKMSINVKTNSLGMFYAYTSTSMRLSRRRPYKYRGKIESFELPKAWKEKCKWRARKGRSRRCQ